MDKIEIKTFIAGDLYNNCYLVFSESLKQAFMVDCPAPCDEVKKFIKDKGIKVLFVALTHAHFDHIQGLNGYSAPFYIHEGDLPLLKDSGLNGSAFFYNSVEVKKKPCLYEEGKFLRFGDYNIEVIHTPGHTPGSVSLKLNNWLFSGDALFFDSIGRTDVPLASRRTLIKSIKEKILTLKPETVVFPGHGPRTTVEREKEHNPFL